ncbi:MAG: hypothetical protein KIT31_38220 [Deltaproteobacteria bacterium]|nr:hypothetical protein [Deltaproteobacteria bacterium]
MLMLAVVLAGACNRDGAPTGYPSRFLDVLAADEEAPPPAAAPPADVDPTAREANDWLDRYGWFMVFAKGRFELVFQSVGAVAFPPSIHDRLDPVAMCPVLEDTIRQIDLWHRRNPRPYVLTDDVVNEYIREVQARRDDALMTRLMVWVSPGWPVRSEETNMVERMSYVDRWRCNAGIAISQTTYGPETIVVRGVDPDYTAAVTKKAEVCAQAYADARALEARYRAARYSDAAPGLARELQAAKLKLRDAAHELVLLEPDFARIRADATAKAEKLGPKATFNINTISPWVDLVEVRTMKGWLYYANDPVR